ncbi:MAG: M36 family metallopeptidase [Acidobacteriia bacterium]|nr:M36 family metallopeptidase [Terriglobia bacterium]
MTQTAAGRPEDIARQFLAAKAGELSLAPGDLPGVFLAKEYQTGHNGVTHMVFRQQFEGIEVWNAEWVTNLDRNGAVVSAGGTLYTNPGTAVQLTAASSLSAVRSAVKAVNPALGAVYAPLQSARPPRRADAIVFAAGDFGDDIEGRLVWFGLRGVLRLAWVFAVTDQDAISRYSVVVEEASGAVLDKTELTLFATPPTGLVFDKGSPQPNLTPGIRLTIAPPLVDRVAVPLVGDLTASPAGWISGQSTAGNNTITGENRLAQDFITPQTTTAPAGNFSFPFTAGLNPLLFSDAANVNLFYWINRAHDLHYQYGFDEASGNFQQDNFGRGGLGGDPVRSYSHFGAALAVGPLLVNAFFSSQGSQDGAPAEVAMFASFSGAGGFFTDGALAAEVIVHEYTHGVSTRLVRQGYSTFQGRSMGEAWSDFYGLEYTLPDGAPPDGIYPAGEYFIQAWGTGIRSRPYSTKMDVNPLTYADLGNVISAPEVHADGEIWMEALMEIRANLIAQFGEAEGRKRVRTLVMDGMKLSVPAPSMVDMRDAILLADRLDFDGASQIQLWAGFAKRGLGVLAYSSGGDTVHVSSSIDTPSATARLKFYDDSIMIGEPIRVLLADSNYTQPTARIQLTSTVGDLEDVVLVRNGSIYVGTVPTTSGAVSRQSGALSLSTFDFVSAYYVDFSTESGTSKLVTASIPTQSPYGTVLSLQTPVTGAELRLTNASNARISYDLPFAFPSYSKQYKSVQVYTNGLIAFDIPVTSACMDSTALAHYAGIAPLWTTLVFGSAQANEGLFVSFPTADSIVFRWAAETQIRTPVNFSATLHQDGAIDFSYGAGNGSTAALFPPAGCGSGPTIGISDGRDLIAQTIQVVSSSDIGLTVRWEPPFNYASVPQVKLETPENGAEVQGVLTVKGVAYDTGLPVSRVDVIIDNIERAVTSTSVLRPDFCAQQNVRGCPSVGFQTNLDLAALNLAPGTHTLRVRATNFRAGFSDSDPVFFTVNAGPGRLPKGAIESPQAGAELSGSVVFSGYAYFDDPVLTVRRVDVLIDGLTYPIVTYGVTRNDICTSLPVPRPLNCPGVGWTLSYNTRTGLPPLPDGPHTMQIRVQDDSGRFTTLPDTPVAFTVKNGPQQAPIGAVTSPPPNAVLTGTVTVSGYAYSPGGQITSVVLLVDGGLRGFALANLPQPDVCASLQNVPACPNIGFSMPLDTTVLTNGPHVLGVRITNNQGLSIIVPALDSTGMNVVINNP